MCRLYIRLRGCCFCLRSNEDVHYTRMGDLETVRRAKNVFNAMSEEGHVKIYKQRMTGCDRQTLEKVFETIERDWGVQINDFPEFKNKIAETRASGWMEDSDKVEVIERSNYGLRFYLLMFNRVSTVANTTWSSAIWKLIPKYLMTCLLGA